MGSMVEKLKTVWRYAWGPTPFFVQAVLVALNASKGVAVVSFWSDLPGWVQTLSWIAVSIVLGAWATHRWIESRLNEKDEVSVGWAIDEAYKKMPKKKSDELAAMWGAMQVAEEIRTMASRGQIDVWGRREKMEARQRIPAEFWIRNQISGLTLTAEHDAVIATESATYSSTQEKYSDLAMPIGDARKVAQRAKSDRNFGK